MFSERQRTTSSSLESKFLKMSLTGRQPKKKHLQKETNLASAQIVVGKRFNNRPRWLNLGSHETLRRFPME